MPPTIVRKQPKKPSAAPAAAVTGRENDVCVTLTKSAHKRFCAALIETHDGITGNIKPVLSDLAHGYADKAGVPRAELAPA